MLLFFMHFTVYILYSKSIDKFYIGKTSLTVEERLQYHLYKHKGFTSRADDWSIIYTKALNSNSDALRLEKKIKNRGAKRFLLDLDSKE